MNIARKRIQLYREYWKELGQYDPTLLMNTQMIDETAIDYIACTYSYWIDISHNNKIVGFLIICPNNNYEECHPEADYTIAQAYMQKAYRKKGLMTNAIKNFINDRPDSIYAFDVIKGNINAKNFWTNLFNNIHAEKIELPEIRDNITNLELFGYRVKNTRTEQCS